MKKLTSALLLSVLFVTAGSSAAVAAGSTSTKSGSTTVSTDRINNWPY
ncbi:MAG: hypothetical protein AVDCRST_MAG83-3443 [uncultured Arthrobacter sp.]|uniref:Uncharacterized protein n=1 Tax=uncultured Arthrobacter sp. TaxID=114050 RepID=A0A6J4J3W7_9MICC|nr:hypothetical protein [Arthrobacter zhaoguopingii]CAA9269623.1 MAG: hypothetical protein AVDCRST_MAG83-3443 [uncultured Arthrobacter sp.]